MNAERLLDFYEQISEAPDAIARLRRFVLDLAVRGKLVEQDAGDEPASKILDQFRTKKSELRRETGDARIKPTADAIATGPWLNLPKGWQVQSFENLFLFIDYRGKTPPKTEHGIPLITAKNVRIRSLNRDPREFIAPSTFEQWMTRGFPRLGDIFFTTEAPLANACLNDIEEPFALAQRVVCLQPYAEINTRFLVDAMASDLVQEMIDREANGMTAKGIKTAKLKPLALPIPPLAEQHRIVAKVDELMALCDRLEEARKTREQVRDKLTAASLARLTASDTTAEDFPTHARFALEALPSLTTRTDQIKALRQTILNLAVRGKLVDQDPADEPASELLAREFALPDGHERRRKIIKETAVDASKGVLTTLPETWEYARIQDLYDAKILIDYADGNHGSLYPRKSEFGDDGVNFVSAKDLVDGRVNWAGCSRLNQKRASQLTKGWAQSGDVLLTHNATVGRVARVPEKTEPFLLGTSVTFYRLNKEGISPNYFFLVLLSPVWQGQLEAIMAQTTRNQVSIQKQAFFTIPVPPLAEQHRIVAKVDGLMALCDRLEAALTTADTTRTRLLEALLHEALEPATETKEAAE